jgi:hypothetical protein
MSDQKLRDQERRWKETGNVEDEAAYLLERVRVGDLSQERFPTGDQPSDRGRLYRECRTARDRGWP